ncbi:hypothetical protein [Verrucomicrobium sp. 3C]|uniref:hypothetical protein n=1 Tax=Verrucomicrobium sp. 3C TaxID=1134055 RepID=UPI000365FC27|nr:hypothetical protein [Verrucomicrobium sp. 3C]
MVDIPKGLRFPVGFGNPHPPNRLWPIGLVSEFFRQSVQPPLYPFFLDPLEGLPIDSRYPAVLSAEQPGVGEHILAVEFVVEGVEAIGRTCLRFFLQRRLELPNTQGRF